MSKSELIDRIDRILVKDNISRYQLTYLDQHAELNDRRDLTDCSVGFLQVALKRAQALDRFYRDPDVQYFVMSDDPTPAETHDMLETNTATNLLPNEVADVRDVDRLSKLMHKYGTTLIGVNTENGDWTKENDGYTVATQAYLDNFYTRRSEFDAVTAVREIDSKYVTALSKTFHATANLDIFSELESLSTYVVDHANPPAVNQKY